MKRFVIVPGYVTSIHDWEEHFISAAHLMDLYRVRPHECVALRMNGVGPLDADMSDDEIQHYYPGLLILRPRIRDYRPVSEAERTIYPMTGIESPFLPLQSRQSV